MQLRNSKSKRKASQVLGLLMIISLLVVTGCGSTSTSTGATGGQKAQRDYILIGLPNPLTGPLAGFGESMQWIGDRVLAAVNKDGGIFVSELNKKLPVKIKVVDTESNPTKAGEVASKLILDDKVDIMLVEHTPDTVNPVAAMGERYSIPTISLVDPLDSWLTGGPYKSNYTAFWSVDSITDQYIAMWDANSAKTNKVVGLFASNDTDGVTWSQKFAKILPTKGYKVVDPGRFPVLTKDYSAIISQFKKENVDIVVGVAIPPDFATFWKQAHQQGYNPKIVSVGKAYLFPSDVAALGPDLGQGLTSEVWWSPSHPFKSSITGETAKELSDAWTKDTGKAWSQPLGYDYAGMELVVDALKRAQSLDKTKLLDAISKTDLPTMVGPIKFNDQHYSQTPLAGGQWVKGKSGNYELQIINNKLYPDIPKTADMLFPIPN